MMSAVFTGKVAWVRKWENPQGGYVADFELVVRDWTKDEGSLERRIVVLVTPYCLKSFERLVEKERYVGIRSARLWAADYPFKSGNVAVIMAVTEEVFIL